MLIFAFGSNLDFRQMLTRCPRARLVGKADLRNYRLAFAGYSHGWGGAVATVEPAAGHRTPGLLFAVGPADLATLDRYEGHPGVYRRVRGVVRDERGRPVDASWYVLEGRPAGAPSERYAAQIRRAWRLCGWDVRRLDRAIARSSSSSSRGESWRSTG